MRIADFLKPEAVVATLGSRTKGDVLSELAQALAKAAEGCSAPELTAILENREKLGSTGVGDGVAIPHGKVKTLPRLYAAFGYSSQGIDFNAIDGKPAHWFFVLVAPENSAGLHLKALARVSRLFKNASFRHALSQASSAQNMFELILAEDAKI